jgi:ATP-dependent Clp protease ATP-binding subunit ClpA
MSEVTDGGLSMGDELRAGSRADDLAQLERDWMQAQARIDELTEAGKRAIQRLLQNPLAVSVLEGEYAEGDRIKVDRAKDGNSLTFEKAREPVRA